MIRQSPKFSHLQNSLGRTGVGYGYSGKVSSYLVRLVSEPLSYTSMYKMGGAVARTFLDACFPLDPLESPNSSQSCISLSPSPPPHAAMTRSPVRHIAFHLFPNHDPVLASDYADFRQMSTMFGDARDVSSFTLENGLPSYDLPLFNWGSLRSIQIEEPHMFTYSTPVDKILDILAANPMLHAFVLAGNRSVREPPVQDRGGALIVRLPALRVLSLQSVDIPYVLDNIACPILEKLKLGMQSRATISVFPDADGALLDQATSSARSGTGAWRGL